MCGTDEDGGSASLAESDCASLSLMIDYKYVGWRLGEMDNG